jgi:hypothetical protein
MSLNFQFPDSIDKSLIEYKRDDGTYCNTTQMVR